VAVDAIQRMPKSKPLQFEYSEELGDVVVTEDFANSPMLITMTNPELFPYGHKLAQLFHTREFDMLQLRYVPSCPTDTGGTVAAVANPDADQPPFMTMEEVLRHEQSVMGAPWKGWKVNLLNRSQQAIPRKFNETLAGTVGLGESGILEDSLHTVADGVVNFAVKGLQSLFSEEKKVREALVNEAKTGKFALPTDEKKKEVTKDNRFVAPRDATSLVTGKLWVDYKVRLFDPVNEDVDTGMYLADGTWVSPSSMFDPAINPFTQNGFEVNELGAATSWTVSDANTAGAFAVDVFEDGYYVITLRIATPIISISNTITWISSVSLSLGGSSGGSVVDIITELAGQNNSGLIVGNPDEGGSAVATWNYAALVHFSAGDSGVSSVDDVLMGIGISVTDSTGGATPTIDATASVSFVGETFEMSALGNKMGKCGGLSAPLNRAFFHHRRVQRQAKAKVLLDNARESMGTLKREKRKRVVPEIKDEGPRVAGSAAAGRLNAFEVPPLKRVSEEEFVSVSPLPKVPLSVDMLKKPTLKK